jgi:hypothetical protein
MKPRKAKASEPSLRDRLSANFLAAFQADFAANGVAAIEALRQKSPEKYSEIAARLIAATEPPSSDDFGKAQSMQDIGRGLLKQVGLHEDAITEQMIEQAIAANDALVARLEQIARGN